MNEGSNPSGISNMSDKTHKRHADQSLFEPTREERELLDGYLDDTLTEEQLSTLEHLLRESPDMRRLYRRLIEVESGLQEQAEKAEPALALTAREDSEKSVSASGSVSAKGPPSIGHWFNYTAVAAITAIMTTIVTSMIAGLSSQTPTEIPSIQTVSLPSVATVIQTTNTRHALGKKVKPGFLSLKSGEIRLAFDHGAVITLKSPVQIEVQNQRSLKLLHGSLLIQNDINTQNFAINTPYAQLLSDKTQYEINVTNTHEDIHVFEGEVFRLPIIGESFQVGTKEAWRFSGHHGEEIKRIALKQSPAPQSRSRPSIHDLVFSHDPFHYPDGMRTESDVLNGGKGWGGPWMWRKRDDERVLHDYPPIQIQDKAIRLRGSAFLNRPLPAPITFDRDADYWFSYEFRISDKAERASIYVNLRNKDYTNQADMKRVLNILSLNGTLRSRLGTTSKVKFSLEPKRWYRLITRLSTRKYGPDRMDTAIVPVERIPSLSPERMPWRNSLLDDSDQGIVNLFAFHVESEVEIAIRDTRLSPRYEDILKP